jgi:phosphatidylinositol-3-phosphatase
MKTILSKKPFTFMALAFIGFACGKQQAHNISPATASLSTNTQARTMQKKPTTMSVPTPSHVVLLIMENHAYQQIIGSKQAPYLNSLTTDTSVTSFTDSYAIEHPSQPNYLDLTSGSNQGMTSDDLPPNQFTTANLFAELIAEGKTFTSYEEGLPSVGFNGATSGEYARKHNPASNWMGTGTNQIPTTTNQPFTAFPKSFASLPTVSIVVPNLDDDMHDGTIKEGDTWTKKNMNAYIKWAEAKANNSLLIITWDEDDDNHGNQIPTLFIGGMVKGGNNASSINHYSVLRTIEDMYGLPYAGASSTAADITTCWK